MLTSGLPSALAVALGLSILVSVAAGQGTQPADAGALRVMSYNVRCAGGDKQPPRRWVDRRELLVQTILRFDPDLLGTQETEAEQGDYLRAQLKDYTFVGVGRNDGQRAGEFSALLFRTKRFELVDSGHFWLSLTPDQPGSKSWDSSLTRMATWAKLKDRQARTPEAATLLFMNTHWDHIGLEARKESGKLMRRKASELAKGLPLIITGDFNSTETSPQYASLVKGDQANDGLPTLVDTHRQVRPERQADEATFHGYKGTTAGLRIDWILFTGPWKTTAAEIDRTQKDELFPSDHYAVTAILSPR